MATKKSSNGNLESAMTMLIQNQAQFVQDQAQFVAQLASIAAKSDERFARIEKNLDLIKALLLQHEDTLKDLPEAIRQKIGFKIK
jgi:hypothetical protein